MKWYVGLALTSLQGCSEQPLGYMRPAGPSAASIADLGWGLITISATVCVVVGVLLLIAIFRKRDGNDAFIRSHDDRKSLRWIAVGTGISTVFLLAAATWTLWTVQNVSAAATPPSVVIDVTAHQWWWEVRYRSPEPSRTFTTANELAIPVGESVQINLQSADIIHSFWVPQLAGKMDTIPGTTNVTRLEADRPGVYRGQCTEFCGMQHAQMAFYVVAMNQAEFDAWWNHQLQPANDAAGDRGQMLFLERCAVCHAVRGLPAGGISGPDLSHFGERLAIGAGILDNDAGGLTNWIGHTQDLKPGAKMPQLALTSDEVVALTAFLEGLD